MHDIDVTMDMFMKPEKYGLTVCPHCHGYGSSFDDPIGVNICTKCNGSGLIKEVA
jgi:DnaJ-class molecular chaperone